jgi:Ca2+/Na+ antiporter
MCRLTVAYGLFNALSYSNRKNEEEEEAEEEEDDEEKKENIVIEKGFSPFSLVLICLLALSVFLTTTNKRWCRCYCCYCSTSMIVAKERAQSSKKKQNVHFFFWCSMLCAHPISLLILLFMDIRV